MYKKETDKIKHSAQLGLWGSAAVVILASLYLLSILSLTIQTQLMAVMTQGFLDKMRREIFNGMQDLPIRFFDSNKTGDIMSYFTNDMPITSVRSTSPFWPWWSSFVQ